MSSRRVSKTPSADAHAGSTPRTFGRGRAIGPAHDAIESEAHHAASRALAGARGWGVARGAPSRLTVRQPSILPSAEGDLSGADIGAGDPLSAPTADFFAARFSHDFSHVRIHDDASSGASARALKARAYTLGSHVVFAPGAFRPAHEDGLRLLAHELAHVVQHDTNRTHGEIRRDGDGSAQPRTFGEVWREFMGERFMRSERARTLARQALTLMVEIGDQVAHGPTLTTFFVEQDMREEARRALDTTRTAWMIAHVSLPERGTRLPRMSGLGGLSGGPEQLVRAAESRARAGRHEEAFELFGTAYQLLSWQLADEGPARAQQVGDQGSRLSGAADMTRAMFYYPLVEDAYRQLRQILGFYRTLEAEQRAAGDTRRAAQYSGLALLLYLEIRDNYVWDSDDLVLTEVQRVRTPRGDALRLFGSNAVQTDVTQLPGLAAPREVTGEGDFSFQQQSARPLTEALHQQTELLAELQSEPAIAREFGYTAIDFDDLQHRLRIWRTMYGVYERQDTLGLGALHALMRLIGRYLGAFTIHTQYNVADFGQSYLAGAMDSMPADLAGRLERDCGVYALTVAYEVYRTARDVSPRLALDFRLFTMPEHVMLVILDRARHQHYVVNNDQVSPPRDGDVLEDVARAYAPMRGHRDLVTPAMEVGLGSTASSDATFRREAWSRYRDAVSWGPGTTAQRGETEAQTTERAYREFYEQQRRYGEGAPRLDQLVSALATSLRATPDSERLAHLQAQVPAIRTAAAALGHSFAVAGPLAPLQTSRPDPALQRRLHDSQRFLFVAATGVCAPALVRAAMVLLHFEQAGGALTPTDRAILALCDRVPSYRASLERYRSLGRPATFCS